MQRWITWIGAAAIAALLIYQLFFTGRLFLRWIGLG